MSIKLSASLMCADYMNMGRDIRALEENGIDFMHFDIMDGHFVPNLMLPPDFVNAVAKETKVPLDIHLMVEKPEQVIPKLQLTEKDYVSIHYESTYHIQRVLGLIKEVSRGSVKGEVSRGRGY